MIKRLPVFIGLAVCGISHVANASVVLLQQATATFSQSGFVVGSAINGTSADSLGWAIHPQEGINQTAVFETTTDAGFAGGSLFTFTLAQVYGGEHTVGHFRLSVTTDDRSTFADGLSSGGAVTANWIVLSPSSFLSANGATLSALGDLSILASGTSPLTDTYTVTATTLLTGITGVRLEVLTDAGLPFNGPGRQPTNGNFVLSEFGVDVSASSTPEPAGWVLLLSGSLFVVLARKKLVPNFK